MVLTLAVIGGLVALIAGVAAVSREENRAEWNRGERQRAMLMVDAAVQRAIAVLQQQSLTIAQQSDDWATLGDTGATQFAVGNDSFRMQIVDDSSFININTASEDLLKHMQMTEAQAECLMDWRDTNKTSRPMGAKDEYYSQLANPYNTKLQSFDCVDELLLVKGFTPESLYTTDPQSQADPLGSGSLSLPPLAETITVDSTSEDRDPAGNQKLDVNSVSQAQLAAIGVSQSVSNTLIQARGGGFRSMGAVLSLPGMTKQAARAIVSNLEVGQALQRPGMLNLNTVTESVLDTVPGLDSDSISGILDKQSTGYRTLGDLIDVPGMDMTVLTKTIDLFCVDSRTFRVRIIGSAGPMQVAAEATLEIEDNHQVRVVREQTEEISDAAKRWNWPDQPTDRVVLAVIP